MAFVVTNPYTRGLLSSNAIGRTKYLFCEARVSNAAIFLDKSSSLANF